MSNNEKDIVNNKCHRCFEPLIVNRKVMFSENDDVITIPVCYDCYEIVAYAASPDSCGDKDMLKEIQGFATNPPKRQKPKTKKDFLF